MDTQDDGVDLTWMVIETHLRDDRGRKIEGELRMRPEAILGVWIEEVDADREWHVSLLVAHVGPVVQSIMMSSSAAQAEAKRLRRMVAEATLKNASRQGVPR